MCKGENMIKINPIKTGYVPRYQIPKVNGFAPTNRPMPKWGCDTPETGGIGGNIGMKFPIGGCDTPDTGGISGNIGRKIPPFAKTLF